MRALNTAVPLLALFVLGCARSPTTPTVVRTVSPVEAPYVGLWTGKLAPRPVGKVASDGVAMSDGLLRSLGGFTLYLRADNTFHADFVGLTREGRWTAAENSVTLRPERVLNLTHAEAERANEAAKSGPKPNDLAHFEPQVLGYEGGELKLAGEGEGAETVLFRREERSR